MNGLQHGSANADLICDGSYNCASCEGVTARGLRLMRVQSQLLDSRSEAAEVGCQGSHFRQCGDGFQCVLHCSIANLMGDDNDFCAFIARIELDDGLNGNALLSKTAADPTNHPRGIFCVETHIVPLASLAAVNEMA